MNLPKSLTTVTPFSKFIALILFILLPIVTFYLGLRYQNPTEYPSLMPRILPTHPIEKACTLEAKICPDGSSVGRTGPNCEFAACPDIVSAQPDISCVQDSDCRLAVPSSLAKCKPCGDCTVYESSDPKVVSVNKNWRPSCPDYNPHTMCPMCIGGITGGTAKCVNNKCQKY